MKKSNEDLVAGCIAAIVVSALEAFIGGWLFMILFNFPADYTHWSHIGYWTSVLIFLVLSSLFNMLRPSKSK